MPLAVVARTFEEPFDIDGFEGIRKNGKRCYDLYRVRDLKTDFSTDRRRMICLYEAPDAEAVRQVSRRLGAPFERAWAADEYERPPGEDRHRLISRGST